MPRGSFLTSEERATVDALVHAEWSVKRIAQHMQRSRTGITSYINDPVNYARKKSTANYRKQQFAAYVVRLVRQKKAVKGL
jgi:IS30 family transposase